MPRLSAERRPDPLDAAIAELAGRQHGVAARRQLLSIGASRHQLQRRLETGHLHPVHRGVYAVGHTALGQRGRWMAAVLAAGPRAVLSHRAAAALWGIRPSARIEVTVAGRVRRRRELDVHLAPLPDDEVTLLGAIPVTEPARTLLDLAGVLPANQVERAFGEAEGGRLVSRISLPVLLARYPRRPGRPVIRRLLELDRPVSGEAFVAAFLRLLDRHRLPRPSLGAFLAASGRTSECDCVWHDQRLMIELDGRSAHDRSAAFESDRARDRAFTAAGWRVIRVTWRQLHGQPGLVAADLHALLRR